MANENEILEEENINSNEIEKLKAFGIKEVAKKTNIEENYIELMINKDFEKLKRANGLGFAKIISREYGLDLSTWSKEFKDYCNTNDKEELVKVAPKLPSYKPREKGNSSFLGLFLVVLIIFFVWFFGFSKYFDEILHQLESNSSEENINSALIEDNANNKLNDIKNNAIKIELNSPKKTEDLENQDDGLDTQKKSENIKEDISEEKEADEDINATVVEDNESENKELEAKEPKEELSQKEEAKVEAKEEKPAVVDSKAVFMPNKKMWVGIRNLNTNKERNFVSNKSFDVELNSKYLVVTGHGDFKVKTDSKELKFSSASPLKLLLENGVVRKLSDSEYKTIRQGKKW